MNSENTPNEGVLEEALRITDGARKADYGSAAQNMANTAAFWRLHILTKYGIDVPLEGADVGWMMIQLKQCRDNSSAKRDNVVDGAGYFRVIARCRGYEKD